MNHRDFRGGFCEAHVGLLQARTKAPLIQPTETKMGPSLYLGVPPLKPSNLGEKDNQTD